MCNPDYRPRAESRSFAAGGKTVKVDRVEWLYIPDPATAQVGLVAGEVDYCESPPTDLPPLMQNNSNLKIAMIDPLGTQGIMPPESSASASQPQRVAYDIVPYVNYGQWFSPTAYRSNLKGVIIFPVPFLPC